MCLGCKSSRDSSACPEWLTDHCKKSSGSRLKLQKTHLIRLIPSKILKVYDSSLEL